MHIKTDCYAYILGFSTMTSMLVDTGLAQYLFLNPSLKKIIIISILSQRYFSLYETIIRFPICLTFYYLFISFLIILFSEWVHAQFCPILYDAMDFSLPAQNFSGKDTKAGCISYSRESFLSRDGKHILCVSCIGRTIIYCCTTQEAHLSLLLILNVPLSY